MIPNEVVLGQLVYIIPSFILYFIEIYVMFFGAQRSKFNTISFNKIFFIYAVNNIIAEILYYFFFRIAYASLFFEFFKRILGYHIILTILWQLLFHTSLNISLIDLILSINRFTDIVIPVQSKALWDGKIKWVIVVVVIFPMICFWNFQFVELTLIYANSSEIFYLTARKESPIEWPSASNILGPCVTIACVGCLILNAYVGFKIHKRKHFIADINYQQERIYFFYTLCIFVNQLLSCSTQVSSFPDFSK